MKRTLHAARLRHVLHYDRLSGLFTWVRPPKYHPRMFGKTAGTTNDGYVVIRIDSIKYKASRLAWLYVFGRWPVREIDHRDLDRSNNRLRNLRLATSSQNKANRKASNRTGLPKGVRMTPSGMFAARVTCRSKPIHIGTYSTPTEAAAAYIAEATRLHGEFARAV